MTTVDLEDDYDRLMTERAALILAGASPDDLDLPLYPPPRDYTTPRVDVYPVGLLADLLRLRRAYVMPHLPTAARRHAWRNLRSLGRRLVSYAAHGRWHQVKICFNGFLAEPTPWPDGVRRCGSGWTRARARRDLDRRLRRAGL